MPYAAKRGRNLVRADESELYRIVMPIGGPWLMVQDGRTSLIPAGQFTILDYTRPYEMRPGGPGEGTLHRHAGFSLPRSLLPLPPKEIACLTTRPLGGDRGAGALVAAILHRISADFDGYEPGTVMRASTALVDLLIASLAEGLGEPAAWSAESRQRAALLRIRAFVDQNIADPGLSVAVIAAAHHLSVRQVHRLFAAETTTVHGWIRQRRLDGCRRDLADPSLVGHSVSAIAARWGLTSHPHFCRLFHRTFGMTPTDYRQASQFLALPVKADGTHGQD